MKVLVTGATGYVGGRLVPRLLDAGHQVRCFARDPHRLQGHAWYDDVKVVRGDVLEPETLPPALGGCQAAYYLIHSLAAEGDFAELDRTGAEHFGHAAAEAGVQRIIYLGGIAPKGEHASAHMSSRLETGEHLRRGGVPVTEFRAAQIVGSGSLSFELVRYLTERVPVMICPKWVYTNTQPIAIRDVLSYLTAALAQPASTGRIVEIGGDVLTYAEMFQTYAEVRGLRRRVVEVPTLTPKLSSLWVGVVTPLQPQVARRLIGGLNNEVVVDDPETARALFPQIHPLDYEEAVRLALRRFSREGGPETSWHGALSSSLVPGRATYAFEDDRGMLRETQRLRVDASADTCFRVVSSLGGETGWLYATSLWRLRGFLDLMMGGVGLRRSRRHPTEVRVGDTLDFWRVEAVEQGRLLRLRAEMKLPGQAWLEFRVEPEPSHDGTPRATIQQTAFYEPKGLAGYLYWWAMYVPHLVLFPGMLHAIGRRAEELHRQPSFGSDGQDHPAQLEKR